MRIRIPVACFTIVAVSCMGGCATQKVLVPTGGSRADATVDMSYDVAGLERAKMYPQQGIESARERCKAWGYADAQPFGGEVRTCNQPSQYGCVAWHVTMKYQCTGGKN